MNRVVSRQTHPIRVMTVINTCGGEALLTGGYLNGVGSWTELRWQVDAGRWPDIETRRLGVRDATLGETVLLHAKARGAVGLLVRGEKLSFDAALLNTTIFWREHHGPRPTDLPLRTHGVVEDAASPDGAGNPPQTSPAEVEPFGDVRRRRFFAEEHS